MPQQPPPDDAHQQRTSTSSSSAPRTGEGDADDDDNEESSSSSSRPNKRGAADGDDPGVPGADAAAAVAADVAGSRGVDTSSDASGSASADPGDGGDADNSGLTDGVGEDGVAAATTGGEGRKDVVERGGGDGDDGGGTGMDVDGAESGGAAAAGEESTKKPPGDGEEMDTEDGAGAKDDDGGEGEKEGHDKGDNSAKEKDAKKDAVAGDDKNVGIVDKKGVAKKDKGTTANRNNRKRPAPIDTDASAGSAPAAAPSAPASTTSSSTPTPRASNSGGGGGVDGGGNGGGRSGNKKSSQDKDAHPYARGSVIEVLHAFRPADLLVPGGGGAAMNGAATPIPSDPNQMVPLLCDVIDRAPIRNRRSVVGGGCGGVVGDSVSQPRWRYYVHYRDFNRRMDEWVTPDRIVGPPSVGAARARAASAARRRREEERRMREERELEERLARQVAASRRQQSSSNAADGGGGGGADDGGGEGGDGAAGSGSGAGAAAAVARVTRRQRKRASTEIMDHPARVAAAAAAGEVLPVAVGPDVVATVPAEELDEHEGLDEASLREHEEVTKVKNVGEVEIGQYRMETWYFSPLPKELVTDGILDDDDDGRGEQQTGGGFNGTAASYIEILYVCEFSFQFFSRKIELLRYQGKPGLKRHPPGNEIYRNGKISMFEVDGSEQRLYCQNLCYIAKLFLDHKTLYYDVDPFLFYVMCEVDNRGFHPVGYFSKEKYSDVGYNLACILTFPSHQRKGYGRFLISFSYELSKKEEKVGSPEKPMSDLGQQAYKPYWTSTIVDFLHKQSKNNPEASMSIMDISKKTSIMAEDIIFTLNQLGILKFINGVYFITAEEKMLEALVKRHPVKEPRVDPSKLHWTPYLTDIKRDKFSIHSKKPNIVDGDEARGSGGF